jgi:hypothetical protein
MPQRSLLYGTVRSTLVHGLFLCGISCLTLAGNGRGAVATEGNSAAEPQYDVVVYGGTAAGIATAVQVRRMGGSVVVIEPTQRIGGLTTGGLGQTDIGNKAAIGGISREFYQRVKAYYQRPEVWDHQPRDTYQSAGQSLTNRGEDAMWTFEPRAALQVLQELVDEYEIPIVYQERLDRKGNTGPKMVGRGVTLENGRIVSIQMESGKSFRGKMFIDATYEGDLLAVAGVNYTVGREANSQYGETYNGVQVKHSRHHQLQKGVDPYIEQGNPQSGLLPGIDPTGPGQEDGGDRRVQAYCFRMCLTNHEPNRLPFAKPADYDELTFELLFRNFEAGEERIPLTLSPMPNYKTDSNNNYGFSTDFIGHNYEYPEGSYEEREQIVARHLAYQQGLMWTLANHPRVPQQIRNTLSQWGTCKDEFARADGWQAQLYIREARRMVGEMVMTQHHCQGRELASRPIGMAAYTMDSHNVQRYVTDEGFVRNEGDVQIGGFPPYPIDYGSVIPRREECQNLLVPVSLSASHIAFGSIRMEPVFMVLGQSAATAAMQAIDGEVAVQDVDFEQLRAKLLADGQVLQWTGPRPTPSESLNSNTLKGLVIDDEQAERIGFDGISQQVRPHVDLGYRHDGDTDKGGQEAIYRFVVKQAGTYQVRLAYTPFNNRATNVPVAVVANGETIRATINQQRKPEDGPFTSVAKVTVPDNSIVVVTISNAGTTGHVILDAVQLLPAE